MSTLHRLAGAAGFALLLGLVLGLSGPAGAASGPLPQGDPARGEQLYVRCLACHALARDRVGPRHCGVVGRRAGSVPGYAYSAAMKATRRVWTPAALDRFLAAPLQVVPGSTMTYDGVADPQERADLIAWLVEAADSPACR